MCAFSAKKRTCILDDPSQRWIDIYCIQCVKTNKVYIGQTVSHVLNHRRYRPYGYYSRFKSHISEAITNNKKKQCNYLNNAIRKYGKEAFHVILVDTCSMDKGDLFETKYIDTYKSLFPNGYNIKHGGKVFTHTNDSKQKLSKGVSKYYESLIEKKLSKYDHVPTTLLYQDYKKLIRPLNREGTQYGWYVWIHRVKVDYGGVHISLDESYTKCIQFIERLRERHKAKHLDAGNSLESHDTTSSMET